MNSQLEKSVARHHQSGFLPAVRGSFDPGRWSLPFSMTLKEKTPPTSVGEGKAFRTERNGHPWQNP